LLGKGRSLCLRTDGVAAIGFGRSLAGISKRSLVAAVQSLFRSSKHCNISLFILGEGRSYLFL